MAYIKLDGFDKVQKELDQLLKKSEKLSGEHEITFDVLFNDSFMQKYTQFSTIEELFDKGGFIINSEEDFNAIPQEELDQYVANTTDFNDWEDMIGNAAEEYVAKQLGIE